MTNWHGVCCVLVLAAQNKRTERKRRMDISDTEDEEMPDTAGIFDNLSHLNVIGRYLLSEIRTSFDI